MCDFELCDFESIKDKVSRFYNNNKNIDNKDEFNKKFNSFIVEECNKYKKTIDLKRIKEDEEYKRIKKRELRYLRDDLRKELEHLLWYEDYHYNVLEITEAAGAVYAKKYMNICDDKDFEVFVDCIYKCYLKNSKYINIYGLPPFDKSMFKDRLVDYVEASIREINDLIAKGKYNPYKYPPSKEERKRRLKILIKIIREIKEANRKRKEEIHKRLMEEIKMYKPKIKVYTLEERLKLEEAKKQKEKEEDEEETETESESESEEEEEEEL